MRHWHLPIIAGPLLMPLACGEAYALEVYIDTTTNQLYGQPGPGRIRIGRVVTDNAKDERSVGSRESDVDQKQNAELENLARKVELRKAETASALAAANEAGRKQAKVSMGEKGLEIESSGGAFKATIGGRLQIDSQVNWHQQDTRPQSFVSGAYPLSDGAAFRRARIFVEGDYYKDWEYRLEYDFVRGNGTTATGITDAFLKVKLFDPVILTFGQYKEPISLDSVTSNRFLTFIERALPNNAFVEFANPYMVGAMIDGVGELSGHEFTARASFQTEPVGAGNPNNSSTNGNGNANRSGYSGNTGWGPIGRFTFLPWSDGTDVVHVGVNGSYREPNNNFSEADGILRNGGMSFGSQIDSNVDRSSLFNTGNLTTTTGDRVVNHFTRFNPEMAVVYGPFSVQGEYFRTQISGRGYDSQDVLDGWYGFASYFFTGESRNYDKKRGAFSRLTPFQNFDWSGEGRGAWELAARWDYLDMNTPHISGGRGQTGTAALNWYINPRVRWMMNYVHVFTYRQDAKSPLASISGLHNDIFETRLQVDW